MKDRLMAAAIFLAATALYVWSCGPGLTAYRDTGEMTSVLKTLGVAHPPGYPLYTLIGSLVVRLLPGGTALAANYFSSLAAAAALAVLYLFLRNWCGRLPSLTGPLLLAFYRPFWELAAVSEMYTLGILWLCLTLEAAHGRRNPALAGLLFGLGLGVRMDTLIVAPAVFWPFLRDRRSVISSGVFAAMGACVFLYLPLRSSTDPLIDWADPETLEGFWRSVARRGYGSGLDLISAPYSTGENFLTSIGLFAGTLWRYLGVAGVGLVVAGIVLGRRVAANVWAALLLAFGLTGPFFLFLANMPPNEHAVAILDAAFVMPAFFLCVLAALGLQSLRHLRFARAVSVVLVALVFLNVPASAPAAVKREAWALRDYSESLLRSTPRGGVVGLREDVQLFALWNAQLVEKRRPDVSVIAVGLSASDWYWRMASRWPVAPAPAFNLKIPQGMEALAAGARTGLIGYETDIPGQARVQSGPHGYLRRVTLVPAEPDHRLLELSVSRREMVRFPNDFFTRDLAVDAARAFHAHGAVSAARSVSDAEPLFRRAQSLDPDFPLPLTDRAFLRLNAGDLTGALELYVRSEALYRDLLRRAAYYKSMPPVIDSLTNALASVISHQGVALEKSGRLEESRAAYLRSIDVRPTAQAHYNLGVTYWNRDWRKASEQFETALRLDPSMSAAASALARARRGGV